MFSLQAEGLHGNHKDINAYHRTDYQYILIQFIETSIRITNQSLKELKPESSLLYFDSLSEYLFQ